ncbi:hypothetical protein LCGC14_0594470 [marine sediment metagenome]|uniref:Transglutaminase-like domain-containing protein n=1 Tax=marine sediment metagenome TaxID=412755 RepID=A0A0F9RHD6_9ZZZZ|nr:MAG: Transglutaminase-like superfamily protein [Candidatus Lokiarchaeum sp. GC14_75]
MSELREEILGGGINKKRVIGVVLVAVLLISVFAFSTFFLSSLFGSLRTPPNKEKANTPYEDVEKIAPPLPLDFLTELLKYLNASQLAKLAENIDPQDLADIIENMNDGDVDDLDLSLFSQALLPLLFGAAGLIEKFRIYDYNSINEMTDALWRYEVFDEYTGDQWISSANALPFNFFSMGEYYSQNRSEDIVQIKMPLSTNIGLNLMGLPILFPTPFILEDSIYTPNLVPDSEILTKDDFNNTAVNLEFNSADSVNMTFELFGSDLPSEQDINILAVLVSAPPTQKYINILNQFTQLPPDFNSYYASQPNFQTHYDALNSTINSTDNAFIIANKTRNYLQSQFTFPTAPDEYQSAPEGRDTVDWFLEQGIGVFSDFATAFCVFSRAFGVASRFVDGFRANDLLGQVEEITYPTEPEKNNIIIRYKNIYNWAEIYVPTDIDGDGMWVQFDVSSGAGGFSLPEAFNMTVNSNFTAGPRGQVANLTAILTSSTNQSVANKEIIFTDYTYGVNLGNATTDLSGTASILIDINNSQVVGPHFIVAQYGLTFNWTMYTVYGDIDVNLTSVNPTMINRSISNSTTIQGFVNDPIANQRVKNATVVFVLLFKDTNINISFPFDTFYANADDTGNFNEIVNVNPLVPRGNYDIRVDFNGSWNFIPLAFGIMNDSSNRIAFNVTEPLTFKLLFSINGQPTDYPNFPNPGNLINIKRGEQLNLSVTLIDESDMSLAPGEIVEFYDYTNGDDLIGTDITDFFGSASILYDVGNTNKSGPTLVYAKFGGDFNYSYYIVNESIVFNPIFGPSPSEINRTGVGTQFDILCRLIDTQGNPINFSQMSLQMYRVSPFIDSSNDLNPSNPSFSNDRGIFSITNMGVQTGTYATNYTLILNFNGNFLFSNDVNNPYKYDFINLNDFATLFVLPNQLKVIDPENVNITLAIEGNLALPFYDDINKPARYNKTTTAHFQVNISHVFNLESNPVYLYDVFTNTLLDTYIFPGGTGTSGFVQFNISTASLHAGLHQIRVQYDIYNTINTTYIIINNTLTIDANSNKNQIVRGTENFIISGSLKESGEFLRGLNITIILLNSSYDDVSFYLNLLSSQSIIINNDGTFNYVVNFIISTCPQGEYYIRIDFNGSISYTNIFLSDYLIHNSSLLIPLNITAGTIIIQDGFHTTPHDINTGLWEGDTLFIYGNLTWDNTTAMTNMKVNVTVQKLNGELIVFNEVVTDSWGVFNASFIIDQAWSEVNYVDEIKIIVYFDPGPNNLEYVEKNELEFT